MYLFNNAYIQTYLHLMKKLIVPSTTIFISNNTKLSSAHNIIILYWKTWKLVLVDKLICWFGKCLRLTFKRLPYNVGDTENELLVYIKIGWGPVSKCIIYESVFTSNINICVTKKRKIDFMLLYKIQFVPGTEYEFPGHHREHL